MLLWALTLLAHGRQHQIILALAVISESQRVHLISIEPVGLGFPHRAERYQPGGVAVSSPVSWSRKMNGLMTQGCYSIISGWRCFHKLPSTTSQWGWGLLTVRGGIDPGGCQYDMRMGELSSPRCAGSTSYLPRVALAPRTLANQQGNHGVGVYD